MKAYPRILKYSLPYTGQMLLSVGCHLLYAFFSLFTFGLIVPFASILFGLTEAVTVRPELHLSADSLMDMLSYGITWLQQHYSLGIAILFVSLVFLTCALLSNFFRFMGLYFLNPVSLNATRDLRNELYNKLLTLPLSFYTTHRTGDLITRLNADMQEVNNAIKNSLLVFSREPFQIIVFFVALLMISPMLTLVSCIAFPLTAMLTAKISESVRRNSKKGQEQLSLINATYEEGISGLRVIRGYGATGFFIRRFHQMGLQFNRITNKVLLRIELSGILSEIISIASLCIVIFTGGYLLLRGSGHLTPNTLILFVILFAKLIAPVQTLIKNINYIEKFMVSVRRIFEVIDSEEVIVEKPDALPLKEFRNEIECRDITFGYEAGNRVLEHFSMTLTKGKVIAVVGASGSGKTTITNLLLRFYDVQEGTVLIDGHDIRDYVISDVRGLMGLVSQEVVLFHDTVYNNLCFGREFTLEQVREAARMANADEFVQALPQGYDTVIGDRGMTLSGGQRQRLSIARALLRDPQILLLDEATASLDSQSEHLVQQALDRMLAGRTALIIAHRLSTVQKADEIIVLDKGRIAERGTHSELYAREGLYHHWVKLQEMS